MAASAVIPVSGACYHLFVEENFMVLCMALLSIFVISLAALIYMGNTGILAGVSTMSDEEKSKLNLTSIARTSGLMLFAATFISFYGMLIALYFYSTTAGIFVWIGLFVLTLIIMVVELNRAKYKAPTC